MAQQLDDMLECKNELAKGLQEKEQLEMEYEHFKTYYNETIQDNFKEFIKAGMKLRRVLELMIALESNEVTKYNLWNLLRYKLHYGISKKEFFVLSQDKKIAICQKLFYELKL